MGGGSGVRGGAVSEGWSWGRSCIMSWRVGKKLEQDLEVDFGDELHSFHEIRCWEKMIRFE